MVGAGAVGDEPSAELAHGHRRHTVGDAEPFEIALERRAARKRHNYRIGVTRAGNWREVLNSDSAIYGGSDVGNGLGVDAREGGSGHGFAAHVTVPPLATVWLAPAG